MIFLPRSHYESITPAARQKDQAGNQKQHRVAIPIADVAKQNWPDKYTAIDTTGKNSHNFAKDVLGFVSHSDGIETGIQQAVPLNHRSNPTEPG